MIDIIQSRQNPLIKERIKLHQKKYRDKTGQFLVEGKRLVEEAIKSKNLLEVFVDEDFIVSEQNSEMLLSLKKNRISCYQVEADLFKTLAETESPQGIVGVAKKEIFSLQQLKINSGLILITDGLQDPGNLGAVLRTAWATGVDALFCLSGTVDPYNGKTVRSSMGGIFHVPIINNVEWSVLRKWCRKLEFQLIAGDLRASVSHFDFTYKERTALIVGNEAQGLLTVNLNDVDEMVKIPLTE